MYFVPRTSQYYLPIYVSLLQIVRINEPLYILIAEMKDFQARLIYRFGFLAFVFFFNHLVLWAQNPALSGIVTNGNNANNITGAKISVNSQTTYSVTGGIYSVAVIPTGTYTVSCNDQSPGIGIGLA